MILEPDRRVRIAAETPTGGVPAQTIQQIHTAEAPWLVTNAIVLNPGLVAIIGARGSGKTALVDILAAGANATESAENISSFLQRASSPVDHLAGASVQLEWGDGGMSDSVPVSLHGSVYEPWDEQPAPPEFAICHSTSWSVSVPPREWRQNYERELNEWSSRTRIPQSVWKRTRSVN